MALLDWLQRRGRRGGIRPKWIAAFASEPTAAQRLCGYRRPGDDEHVVRFKPDAPNGLPRKLAEWVPVAGVTKGVQALYLAEMIENAGCEVELVRDPDNELDENAIRVYWNTASGSDCRRQIGWVPATTAREIAKKSSGGRVAATVVTIFQATGEKSAGLRMDIWGERRRRRGVVQDD